MRIHGHPGDLTTRIIKVALANLLGVCAALFHANALADTAARCQKIVSTPFTPPADARTFTIDSTTVVAATADVPEYCQVIGHLDQEVNFVLKLPTLWNQKLLMEGNSGFAGDDLDLLAGGLDWDVSNHYAAVATDTGHNGGPEQLLDRPDRIANLLYRSVHIVSLAAKQWVEQSTPPKSIIGLAPDTNTTQPICAYPKQARLISKTADPSVASSYRCINPDGNDAGDTD